MDNKNKLIIGLAAACCLLVGLLVGVIVARPKATKHAPATENVFADADDFQAEEEQAPATKKTSEEKTYGFYPSFYVKKAYYTVSGADADHTLQVYGTSRVAKAWTDSRWLEEEKLEKGGNYFHVKENKDHETRKGKLFLQDESGRKITIYVTQRS